MGLSPDIENSNGFRILTHYHKEVGIGGDFIHEVATLFAIGRASRRALGEPLHSLGRSTR